MPPGRKFPSIVPIPARKPQGGRKMVREDGREDGRQENSFAFLKSL